uniref:Uncharacterized protein n=1 Tax=Ditylenchus dipsaci TaxID=166011 RepID=A0A915E0P4_9BILA
MKYAKLADNIPNSIVNESPLRYRGEPWKSYCKKVKNNVHTITAIKNLNSKKLNNRNLQTKVLQPMLCLKPLLTRHSSCARWR